MKKKLLLLALLGWAETPAIEAQPESAYYGVSSANSTIPTARRA
jgi:hypothetical protein